MLKNYFKIALRSLVKQKGHAFINITGLAVGMACCLLILLYVHEELSFDQYHQNKDRIYRLATRVQGASYEGIAKVNGPWGPAVKKAVPEVQEAVRFVIAGQMLVSRGEKRLYEDEGLYADSTVFEVFSFPLLRGDPHRALTAPHTMVVTRGFAQKYFGKDDPVGQSLRLDNQTDFLITGLLENLPANSHFTFDFLLSMASLTHPQRESWSQWNQFYTYLLLQQHATPKIVEAKVPAVLRQGMGEQAAARFTPFLQPLTRLHLHSHLFRELSANSDMSYIYIFSSVALFILAIAAINFINLSTAQAARRAKEVGVRKVLGSQRRQLVGQFLTEAILLCVIAVGLAITLAELLLPDFNAMVARNIIISWRENPLLWLAAAGFTLLVGVLAGCYPAFALSAYQPVTTLKGQAAGVSRKSSLRNALVVFQFALSAFLLMATGVIYRQAQFIHNKNLGFNTEQIITIPIQDPRLGRSAEAVKNELLQNSNVVSVAVSANLPGGSDWGIPVQPEGRAPEQVPPLRILAVDADFLNTYQISIAQGRGFSKEIASDSAQAFMLNEEAAKQLGWTEPLGKLIAMPAIQRARAPVIGLVQDFHFRSLREPIGPLLLLVAPTDWRTVFSVRLRPEHIPATLKFLEEKWQQLDPAHPFTYSFLDDRFAQLYQNEERLQHLSTYAAGLGMLIACLGLFGLVSFTTSQRIKEIGIRKVLGATTAGITGLLSQETMRLILLANLLAAPVAYLVMRGWLQGFAYRAEMNLAIFAGTGLATIALALATVSYRACQAAYTNPAEALKYE